MSARPYADGAMAYVDAGWSVVPVAAKYPPIGIEDGQVPQIEQVFAWIDGPEGACNLAVLVPDGVVGIDADLYRFDTWAAHPRRVAGPPRHLAAHAVLDRSGGRELRQVLPRAHGPGLGQRPRRLVFRTGHRRVCLPALRDVLALDSPAHRECLPLVWDRVQRPAVTGHLDRATRAVGDGPDQGLRRGVGGILGRRDFFRLLPFSSDFFCPGRRRGWIDPSSCQALSGASGVSGATRLTRTSATTSASEGVASTLCLSVMSSAEAGASCVSVMGPA